MRYCMRYCMNCGKHTTHANHHPYCLTCGIKKEKELLYKLEISEDKGKTWSPADIREYKGNNVNLLA